MTVVPGWRRLRLALGLSLGVVAGAHAQPQGTPTSVFLFDQQASTPAEAQSYTYRLYVDGSTTPVTLANVTCQASATPGVQTCRAPFPAFTPGRHSVTLSAGNSAGESAQSAAFVFTLVAIPGTPTNIRIGSNS